eukprot:CFRG3134T1
MAFKMPSISDTEQINRKKALAKSLLKKKDEAEEELKDLYEALRSHGVGMSESLVDSEGFPRADLEIHQIRILRNTIAHKTTDNKQLTSCLEKAIHELHAEASQSSHRTNRTEALTTTTTSASILVPASQPEEAVADISSLKPFLNVSSVIESSPAWSAGIEKGDGILMLGSANAENFQGLQDIADLVNDCENRNVHVAVVRGEERLRLNLIPKKWSGRGLLGCHIVPV